MKLGIFLLLLGLILAGVGIASWQYGTGIQSTVLGIPRHGSSDYQMGKMASAAGLGVAVLEVG